MKITIRRVCNLLCFVPMLAVPAISQAISIGFNPPSQSVAPGDTIMTDVVISDLGSGAVPSVSTFDLDVLFDDSHLSFVSAGFGAQLDLFGLGSVTSSSVTAPGVLNLFELSFDLPGDLDALQADNFTLATITFDVLTADASDLGIGVNALGDSFGDPLTAEVENGSVTSTDSPIPVLEPGTAMLFISGFLALRLGFQNNGYF